MKIRVLGCSGAIAKDCRTTAFLVDDTVLIDAGTGVGDLALDEMARIDHVFLTHSHLDHVAALPLMLDAVGLRARPLQVHGLPDTLRALQQHIFNDVIWPDFARIPTPSRPFLEYRPLASGERLCVAGRTLEALPALHTVPALGYAVEGDDGWWVFSGDTGGTPALWQRLQSLEVAALVIETAFSTQEADLARRSGHLSPATLAHELAQRPAAARYPVYITHTKPSEADRIIQQIRQLARATPGPQGTTDIQMLAAGQILYI